MDKSNMFFENLWRDYTKRNPEVAKIYDLFTARGETIVNDHIAFRTFDHPKINIDMLSLWFIDLGYELKGDYNFEAKKLNARHFEHKTKSNAPRIFISQLRTGEFSKYIQELVKDIVSKIPLDILHSSDILTSGNLWDTLPSYNVYNRLREESEYAAWLYLFGFTVNHFAINVNNLEKLDTLEKINQFLKDNGYNMNTSGGEIKGSPEKLLEQSSIKATRQTIEFKEGNFDVPVTYYEFTKRYKDSDGNLFSGFIANSADKIFESTDYYEGK